MMTVLRQIAWQSYSDVENRKADRRALRFKGHRREADRLQS